MTTMERTTDKIKVFRLTDQTKAWMVYGICLLCLAVFSTAAYGKLADHDAFYRGLSKVALIGVWASYLSWAVPVAEILVSILLIVPRTQRLGLYGFTGLMTVFTGYILSMLFWAERLPCHCNLIIDNLSWEGHVWFNLGFIALAIYALWLSGANSIINRNI